MCSFNVTKDTSSTFCFRDHFKPLYGFWINLTRQNNENVHLSQTGEHNDPAKDVHTYTKKDNMCWTLIELSPNFPQTTSKYGTICNLSGPQKSEQDPEGQILMFSVKHGSNVRFLRLFDWSCCEVFESKNCYKHIAVKTSHKSQF